MQPTNGCPRMDQRSSDFWRSSCPPRSRPAPALRGTARQGASVCAPIFERIASHCRHLGGGWESDCLDGLTPWRDIASGKLCKSRIGSPYRPSQRAHSSLTMMPRRVLMFVLVAVLPAGLAACAGATAGRVDAGSDEGASSTGSSGSSGTADASSGSSTDATEPLNHRPDDTLCSQPAPPGNCSSEAGVCASDTGCSAHAGGRCNVTAPPRWCSCTYDMCAHDTDCVQGQTCACHMSAYVPFGSVCVPGNCRVDADCGPGGFCSPSLDPTLCRVIAGYYCHTAADECVNDADCGHSGETCSYLATRGRWECYSAAFCPLP